MKCVINFLPSLLQFRHSKWFLFPARMIDCTALMLSLGYTLLFIQIVSPIIYYPGLRRAGSSLSLLDAGKEGKLVGK